MNAAHTRRDVSKGPSMHQTSTTDYIVLLSGRVAGWFLTRRIAISSRSTLSSNAGPTTRGSIPATEKRC